MLSPPKKNSPGSENKIQNIYFSKSILSKLEKIDFTPQLVNPGWTAGGLNALWVSEHFLWQTRY